MIAEQLHRAPARTTLLALATLLVPQVLGAQGVRFEHPSYSALESARRVTFCVIYPGGAPQGAFAQVRTNGQTADASDGDYTFLNVVLTFAPGLDRRCGAVEITDDDLEEGDETFLLEITDAGPASVDASGSTAQVTIVDDDAPGPVEVFFAETYPPASPGEPAVFLWPDPVSWNKSTSGVLTLPIRLTRASAQRHSVEVSYGFTVSEVDFGPGAVFRTVSEPLLTPAEVAAFPPIQLVRPSPGLEIGRPDRVEIDVYPCVVNVFGQNVACAVLDGASVVESGAFECAYDMFCALLANRFPGVTTCEIGAPATSQGLTAGFRAAQAGTAGGTSDVLRTFRDQRMSATRAGRYYRDLYRAHSRDLALTLIPRATLVKATADAQAPWVAALDAATQGQGDSVTVTQAMVSDMLAIFDRFESEGSPELARVFRAERERLQLEQLAGQTIEGAIDLVETRGGPPPCATGETSLCLNQGRFLVDVLWHDFDGGSGEGRAIPMTDDSGGFWFFDADNVELVVKVLDATAVNGHFWVFYGALSNVQYTLQVTDTMTGAVRVYANPSGRFASAGDTQAFTPDGSVPEGSSARGTPGLLAVGLEAGIELLHRGWRKLSSAFGRKGRPVVAPDRALAARSASGVVVENDLLRRPGAPASAPADSASCVAGPNALCLEDGRFRAEVAWREFGRRTGVGQARPLTNDTGTFWFFDAANVELVVKVLDGRGVNGHHWVFYGALSNVEYTLTVTDTETGESREYHNPLGEFGSHGDTEAF